MNDAPTAAFDRLAELNKKPHAKPGRPAATDAAVSLDDFRAYMPMHCYIYAPTREMWPAVSVNARIPPLPLLDHAGEPVLDENGDPQRIAASRWLDRHKPVEQMTWAPGLPLVIADRLISKGGWIERDGVHCFNLYRPPIVKPGNAAQAGPWLDHVDTVFGAYRHHIVRWLAHRVQRPQDKINHALVLGGAQGIGKDSLLEPVKYAVGPWNFVEVSPAQMLGRFNGFVKSVILRVSEARDLGDFDRFRFYDHMKVYTAAPPDVLRVDEKNLREHSVLNCTGVVITTNHKADGIFLPADDRRHYVAWSDLAKEDFGSDYWIRLWTYYGNGGFGHVAAYLAQLDLDGFDPKAPPPKTEAFWEVVNANRAPEDAELADVIDALSAGTPHKDAKGGSLPPLALTLAAVARKATELAPTDKDGNPERSSFAAWLRDRRHRRQIPHRFERCGYSAVRNDAAKDGLWKVAGARQVIYALDSQSLGERLAAAKQLVEGLGETVFTLELSGWQAGQSNR